MGGTNVNLLSRLSADPIAWRTTASERQGMRAIPVDDGKLKIEIKRRGLNGLPFHQGSLPCRLIMLLDLNQDRVRGPRAA
jgi:hypothetical protein